MLHYGSGANGLALIITKQSEKDEYRGDLWLDQPILKMALPSRHDRQSTLRIALRPHGQAEKMSNEDLAKLRPEVEALLRAHAIRAVVAVGAAPTYLLTGRSGSEERRAGAVIQTANPWVVVPISPPWKVEGELLLRLMAKYIKRAALLARGAKPHTWQRLHVDVGEGMLRALQDILRRGLPVGVDIETAGLDVLKVPITAMGLADEQDSVSVPWETYTAGKYGVVPGIDEYGELGAQIKRTALAILEGPQTKVLHNGGYDVLGLRARGIHMGGSIEDTILQHRVCFPERAHGLQTAAVGEFLVEPWKADFKAEVGDFVENVAEDMRLYNAKDAGIEPGLYAALDRRLYGVHNGHAIYSEYKELAAIASRMQEDGMRCNRARAVELKWELEWSLGYLATLWADLWPYYVNEKGENTPAVLGKTGATQGVKRYFLETLGAPVVAKSLKTGLPSVPAAALLEYRALGKGTALEAAAQINFYYRKNAKLLTAFVLKLAEADRVHPTFHVWGTKGARWSAKSPNLMQISKDKSELSADGKTKIAITPNIRDLFQADEGHVLIEADYSQLELREVAYFSDMLDVLEWLEQDRLNPGSCDAHTMHARMMFKDPSITKKDKRRDLTKTLTYALFYNYYQGVETVYKALKPTFPTLTLLYLQDVQKRFYAARPQLPAWQESIAKFGREHGYVEAPLSGRRMYQPGPKPDINMWLSFPVQSTGGDVCNGAVRRIAPRLDRSAGEHICIQVHDALIVQARPENAEKVARILKEEMERPVTLYGKAVSFPVDTKLGPDWKNMESLDL